MELSTPPLRTWEQAEAFLLEAAGTDLAAGLSPAPSLVACIDDEPVAIGTLRPFDEEGPVPPLVEVLALLLPLGVNRVALLLAGRAWSTLDPIPPVTEDHDLRARVVVLVQADGVPGPCRLTTQLRELERGSPTGGWRLGEPLDDAEEQPIAPLLEALAILIDRRDELDGDTTGNALVAQLGRVLLLGHELALAPRVATPLAHASTS